VTPGRWPTRSIAAAETRSAGAKFENGKLIERPDETTTKEAAA
jgi:hypothetical protein